MVNEPHKVKEGERYIIANKELPITTREEFIAKYGELKPLNDNEQLIEKVIRSAQFKDELSYPTYFPEENKGPIGAITPRGRKGKRKW